MTDLRHQFGNRRDENGLLQGEYEDRFNDGTIRARAQYKDGAPHGLYEEWHANGQLWERCYYKEGLLHGEYKLWYSNGQLKDNMVYVNGHPSGVHTRWNSSGTVVEQTVWRNGHNNGEWRKLVGNTSKVKFTKRDKNMTGQVMALVEDIHCITDEEAMMIELKFGMQCIRASDEC